MRSILDNFKRIRVKLEVLDKTPILKSDIISNLDEIEDFVLHAISQLDKNEWDGGEDCNN